MREHVFRVWAINRPMLGLSRPRSLWTVHINETLLLSVCLSSASGSRVNGVTFAVYAGSTACGPSMKGHRDLNLSAGVPSGDPLSKADRQEASRNHKIRPRALIRVAPLAMKIMGGWSTSDHGTSTVAPRPWHFNFLFSTRWTHYRDYRLRSKDSHLVGRCRTETKHKNNAE